MPVLGDPTAVGIDDLNGIRIRVKRQFGDESGAQITTDDIDRWANDGQLDIARRVECIFLSEAINSVRGQKEYNLPANFLFLKRITYQGRLLSPVDIARLDSWNRYRDVDDLEAPPEYFSVRGTKLQLYPLPEASVVSGILVEFVAKPTTVSSSYLTLDIPVSYREALVRFCLMRAYELNDDWVAAGNVRSEYESMLNQARYEQSNLVADSYPVIRDDPEDHWWTN